MRKSLAGGSSRVTFDLKDLVFYPTTTAKRCEVSSELALYTSGSSLFGWKINFICNNLPHACSNLIVACQHICVRLLFKWLSSPYENRLYNRAREGISSSPCC